MGCSAPWQVQAAVDLTITDEQLRNGIAISRLSLLSHGGEGGDAAAAAIDDRALDAMALE